MTDKIKKYLPWLFLIASAGMWMALYLLRVEKLLDADMSSEMVLSKMLASEGRIITPNWKYSTEIRLLNNQLFFSLFLAITKSFRISRLLSGAVLLLIYGASYYYLCVQAGLKKYFPLTALSEFHYDLSSMHRLSGGWVEGGIWTIPPEMETTGPNMTLYAGVYHFVLSGEGLDRLQVRVTNDFRAEELPSVIVTGTDNYMEVRVTVEKNTYHVEFCLNNPTEHEILVDSAAVNRIGSL